MPTTLNPSENAFNEATRRHLASLVAKLFDRWGLDSAASLALLGMSPNSRSLLPKYRNGERALPAAPDVLDRVGYLLGIHKGLRLLYPRNEAVRYGWVNMPNRMLDGRTPLSVMRESLVGLARIARFVDFERGR